MLHTRLKIYWFLVHCNSWIHSVNNNRVNERHFYSQTEVRLTCSMISLIATFLCTATGTDPFTRTTSVSVFYGLLLFISYWIHTIRFNWFEFVHCCISLSRIIYNKKQKSFQARIQLIPNITSYRNYIKCCEEHENRTRL